MSALELVLSGDPQLFGIAALSLYVSLSATAAACLIGLPLSAALALNHGMPTCTFWPTRETARCALASA